jgi:hypothetical protein
LPRYCCKFQKQRTLLRTRYILVNVAITWLPNQQFLPAESIIS